MFRPKGDSVAALGYSIFKYKYRGGLMNNLTSIPNRLTNQKISIFNATRTQSSKLVRME